MLFGYPHNSSEVRNLDWLLKQMIEISNEVKSFIEKYGAITFSDPVLHDPSLSYPSNVIVIDSNNTAYISKQPVPVGIPLYNEDYWFPVISLNDLRVGEVTITDGVVYFNKTLGSNIDYPAFRNITESEVSGKVGEITNGVDKPSPLVHYQKYVDHNQLNDQASISIGTGLFENIATGSDDGLNPNLGGFVSLFANGAAISKNKGTTESQLWDYKGPVIGLAGHAQCDGFNNDVVTALWANALSAKLSDDEYNNLPANSHSETIGLEVNCWIRHPDSGYKPYRIGKGNVTGILLNNYQEYDYLGETPTQKNWNFGIAIDGTPIDGDYSSADINNFNSHYVGIRLDKIINQGIAFGQYMGNDCIGIEFPSSFAGMTERPKNSIALGDTLMNLGGYMGAHARAGDFGRSGKNLVYCRDTADTLDVVLTTHSATGATGSETPDRLIEVIVGGERIQLLGKYVGSEV